jgi:hypothetical protein
MLSFNKNAIQINMTFPQMTHEQLEQKKHYRSLYSQKAHNTVKSFGRRGRKKEKEKRKERKNERKKEYGFWLHYLGFVSNFDLAVSALWSLY